MADVTTNNANRSSNNAKIRFITTTALMAAVICILGPLSIPIGPVPISLTNLAIYFTMYILDTKRGVVAYLIYMLIGLFVDKYYKKRVLCVIVMEAATWIAYLLGTIWLAVSAGMTFKAALWAGVIPFIAEDLIKMVLAAVIGPTLRTRLSRFTALD